MESPIDTTRLQTVWDLHVSTIKFDQTVCIVEVLSCMITEVNWRLMPCVIKQALLPRHT